MTALVLADHELRNETSTLGVDSSKLLRAFVFKFIFKIKNQPSTKRRNFSRTPRTP